MLEPQAQTPDLRKLCLRLCPVGTIATSSKSFEFKLLSRDPLTKKESWLDLKSGVAWHDKEDGNYTYDEAIEKFGESALPTKEDFELAERHGFREILPRFEPSEWYWSASFFSGNPVSAWLSKAGLSFMANFVNSTYNYSVRCISYKNKGE